MALTDQTDRHSKRWRKPRIVFGTLLSAGGGIVAALGGIASSRQETALITGGDTFCYIDVLNQSQFNGLVAVTVGQYPLYDVRVRITNLDKPSHPVAGELGLDLGVTVDLGNLPPRSAKLFPETLPTSDDSVRFDFFFAARNGFWDELLRRRRVKGRWSEALKVERDGKILKQEISADFPLDHGKVKW